MSPNIFLNKYYPLNHPDHRAAGQVVLNAIFPAAGSPLIFPELLAEGLDPHSPKEIWLSLTSQPNSSVDVTETWETTIEAILKHKSQAKDPEMIKDRMRYFGKTKDNPKDAPRYEEHFTVLRWRR